MAETKNMFAMLKFAKQQKNWQAVLILSQFQRIISLYFVGIMIFSIPQIATWGSGMVMPVTALIAIWLQSRMAKRDLWRNEACRKTPLLEAMTCRQRCKLNKTAP